MRLGLMLAEWGYRNVSIELWTHAIGGLSENDFILAAKIDQVPIDLKWVLPARRDLHRIVAPASRR